MQLVEMKIVVQANQSRPLYPFKSIELTESENVYTSL